MYQSWSRTLGVVRGLTSFKRITRRGKRKDKEEKQVLWRKLALRMKILNILSTKHYRRQRETVALRKLKKRLGDLNLQTEHEAAMVQNSLETCLGNNLSFRLQPGDLVINEFETLAWLSGRKLRRRNTSSNFRPDPDVEELRLVFLEQDNMLRTTKPWENCGARLDCIQDKKIKSCYKGPVVVVSPPQNTLINNDFEENKQDLFDKSETAQLLSNDHMEQDDTESQPKKKSDFILPSVKNVKKKLQTLVSEFGRTVTIRT